MRSGRRCSRSGCGHDSVATLTYVYSDSTAVLGPLATYAEPHSYDLCEGHAARLTAPRGWEVVRLSVDDQGAATHSQDDLLALVEAVREAARPKQGTGARGLSPGAAGVPGRTERGTSGRGEGQGGADRGRAAAPAGRGLGRRGHLRVLGPADDTAG